ncbi:MAG TPA: type II secretion system protein GspC [Myxococcaceae bacterium]|nr:type II secretion system protein GspC [Myxococcaceae bacterium]
MELFFKKYFWTVNLAFLALVALIAAGTVNLFVESALAPVPSGQAQRATRTATPVMSSPPLNLGKLATLVGLPLPAPEPVAQEATQQQLDMDSAPVKSSLRVRLLGTLLSSLPQWSIASIQDVTNQRSTTYMVGDELQGARILEIERSRVIILNNNRREFINNEPGDGAGPPMAFAAPPPIRTSTPVQEPGTVATGASIRAVNENEYEVPRGEIDRTLSNLNDVAMQARIVPAFKDGVAQGFKLFSIRPDSIYTKIGIQNGDVIKRINGYDLNSPEKALEVYSKLKEASRIDIEVERNGSVVRKTYNVR